MIQNNEDSLAKKFWQKPDFYILDSNDINNGGSPGVHENSFTAGGNNVNGAAPKFLFWYANAQRARGAYYS